MCRMAKIVRHNCGELKNTDGHRCYKVSFSNFQTPYRCVGDVFFDKITLNTKGLEIPTTKPKRNNGFFQKIRNVRKKLNF